MSDRARYWTATAIALAALGYLSWWTAASPPSARCCAAATAGGAR